jgi:sulfonate transport system permease protein
MIRGRQLNQIDVVLVTALVIGVVGFLLDIGVSRLERFLPPFEDASKAGPRRASNRRISFVGLIIPVVAVFIWSWASREGWVDSRFLPSPWQCVKTFKEQCVDGELLADVGWSLQRMAAGLLWGTLGGIAFGTLLGRVKWLGNALMPSFNAFRQVTLVAWIPPLTLWVGQGEEAKETFIALAVFVPLALSAFEGARSVSNAHLELSAVLETRSRVRLWAVTLPSALPHLWAGLELGLVYAWLATIAAEYFFRVAPGIGNAMIDGREHFRMDLVIGAITVVAVTGFTLNRVACELRTRLLGWNQ